MKKLFFGLAAAVFPFLLAASDAQKPLQIKVSNKVTTDISPWMWGIFYEDINFAADGGLYSQLVKNGSFEFPQPKTGWVGIGGGTPVIMNQDPCFKNNPNYARIFWTQKIKAPYFMNEGYRGMGLKKDEKYDFGMWVRMPFMDEGAMRIELVEGDPMGDPATELNVLASAVINISGSRWQKVTATLVPSETVEKGKLRIYPAKKGVYDIDAISLFPQNTWKGRPEGLRADLTQALADLKPSIVRFPGGCIVEGTTLDTRYDWKNTLQPREERRLTPNLWNDRNTPLYDYFQSYGLGYYEFFILCEDLGAEPMPIVNCGISCQGRNAIDVVPMDQLQSYIDEALDLIEFANGPVDSRWGKVRAQMGHPEPFGMKMMGVGNENFDTIYIERFAAFQKAIKAQYPDMILIAGAGMGPDNPYYKPLWAAFTEMKADFVDEHSYRIPKWFYDNVRRYDNYNRKGPKVYLGEFAAKESMKPNRFEFALSEAAFMTGLERNADVVRMASYAPLMAHQDAAQWRPDMIFFNNLEVLRTSSWYVQYLFSTNRGTHVLSSTQLAPQTGVYSSAVIDKNTDEVIVKIVNSNSEAIPISLSVSGVGTPNGRWTVLTAKDLNDENSFDHPDCVVPVEKTILVSKGKMDLILDPISVNVIRVKK